MTDAERKVVRACVDALRAYSPIRIVSAPNGSFELIVQHGETGREHSLAGCSNRMYAIALAAVLNKARAEALHAGRASEPRADDPERVALADVASLVCGKDDDWDRDEVWRRVRDGLAERDRLAVAVVEARKEAGKWRDAALVRAEQAEREQAREHDRAVDASGERDRLAAEVERLTVLVRSRSVERESLAAEVERLRVAEGEAMLVVEAQETNMKRLEAELATARRLLDRARTALRFHRVLDHKDTMQLVADIDVEYRERGPAKER